MVFVITLWIRENRSISTYDIISDFVPAGTLTMLVQQCHWKLSCPRTIRISGLFRDWKLFALGFILFAQIFGDFFANLLLWWFLAHLISTPDFQKRMGSRRLQKHEQTYCMQVFYGDLLSKVEELMSPAAKAAKEREPAKKVYQGRNALEEYIIDPANFDEKRVLYYNKSYVVINDMYPKASVHLLVLPRDKVKTRMHPFEAFKDDAFRKDTETIITKFKTVAARHLERTFGLKDCADRIKAGVHAVPSMGNLHVHIISNDNHGCIRHRNHYNSFNTAFFVKWYELPLRDNDQRWHSSFTNACLSQPFVCWKCKANFGNRFKVFSEHLNDEFAEWKKTNAVETDVSQ